MSPQEEDHSVVIVGLGLRLDNKPAASAGKLAIPISSEGGEKSRVFVTELISGGAAQRSNLLKFNDEILSVDHVPVSTNTVVDVKNAILGTPGTSVRISIRRDNEQFELSFVRGHTSGSGSSPKQGQAGSAEKSTPHAQQATAAVSAARPTPKALFRSPNSMLAVKEDKGSPAPHASINNLHEAMRAGNLDMVAKLAAELSKLAAAGDASSARAILDHDGFGAGSFGGGGVCSDLGFSPKSVSVLHSPQGLTFTSEVPTLQYDGASPLVPSRLSLDHANAKELLALIEPLMDATYQSRTPPHVDRDRLRDLVQAVAAAASKVQATEPRMLEIAAPCYVLGDLHGNITDLTFFRNSIWPAGPSATGGDFLFLGDFVDRGADSLPVVAYMMAHKVLSPKKWWMIRGNHETREVNGNVKTYREGSFLQQCVNIFGERDGRGVWEGVNDFFDTLPLAARIANRIFCVHGGIPRELCRPGASLEVINEQACPLPVVRRGDMVHSMLWSDPVPPEREATPEVKGALDHQGFGLSSRGCACFGERTLDIFLAQHRLSYVFRGHEAQQNGIGLSRSARLCTVFSTSKDHFAPEVPTTCGCLLVQRDSILPIVRGRPADSLPTPKPAPTPTRTHHHASPTSAGSSQPAHPSHVHAAASGHAGPGSPGGGGGGGAHGQVAAQPPMAVQGRSERFALRSVENVEGGGAPSSCRKSPGSGRAERLGAGPPAPAGGSPAAGKENDGRLFVC